VKLACVRPTEFQALAASQFGIQFTAEENNQVFQQYGKKSSEGVLLDLESYIARVVRNELSLDINPELDKRDSFKRRSGSLPLQYSMHQQDSKKLLTFNKAMTNFDGTRANLDPSKLGYPVALNAAMSPEFKPRHPGQRIGRRCQSGIIGLGDQYHDSALVRGYADVWVPPQGPGSWSADPTRGGDAIKVGENTQCPYLFGSRERKDIVANSPLNQPRVIVKAPLGSHMMMTHEVTGCSS